MKVFFLRTPRAFLVTRTDPSELVGGNERSFRTIAEMEVEEPPGDNGRIMCVADDPAVQELMRQAFLLGAKWGQKHSFDDLK